MYKKSADVDQIATAFSFAGLDHSSSGELVHDGAGNANDIAQARALALAKIADHADEYEDLEDVKSNRKETRRCARIFRRFAAHFRWRQVLESISISVKQAK